MRQRKNISWRPVIRDYQMRKITRKDIMEKYACTNLYIKEIFRYHKVKIWDETPPTNEFDVLVQKYKNKEISREEIVDRLGIEMVNVTSRLRRQGIELWDRKKTKIESVKDKLIELFNAGLSIRKIAQELEISHAGAWQKLCQLGLVTWNKRNGKAKQETEKAMKKAMKQAIQQAAEQDYIKNKNRDYNSEYHNYKMDKSPYALIFYNYND